jgi:transcriptional regulator with XRE-family HTH domain
VLEKYMIKVILNRQALEKELTRRNLSRKVFAAEIGMSRSHLARVVWGKTEPSCALRQRLLEYFKDCTFDDLFTIEETK